MPIATNRPQNTPDYDFHAEAPPTNPCSSTVRLLAIRRNNRPKANSPKRKELRIPCGVFSNYPQNVFTMKRLPGVILFLILALVILEIVTLYMLSNAQKRIAVLEKKVEALQPPAQPPGK